MLFLKSKIPDDLTISKNYVENDTALIYPDKFHQIFLNLLSNAVDAACDIPDDRKLKKTIEISTDHRNIEGKDFFHLSIYNTGPNIPEEAIHQIFDPFYTTKDPGKGTGLGLWIVYKLVEDHKGSISAVNHANGVEFMLTLPIVEESPLPIEEKVKPKRKKNKKAPL